MRWGGNFLHKDTDLGLFLPGEGGGSTNSFERDIDWPLQSYLGNAQGSHRSVRLLCVSGRLLLPIPARSSNCNLLTKSPTRTKPRIHPEILCGT